MKYISALFALTTLAAVTSAHTGAVSEPRRAKAWHRAVVAANGVIGSNTASAYASTSASPAIFESKSTSTSASSSTSRAPSVTSSMTTSKTSSQSSPSSYQTSSSLSVSSSSPTKSPTPSLASTTTSTSSSSPTTSLSAKPSTCKAVPAKNGPSSKQLVAD